MYRGAVHFYQRNASGQWEFHMTYPPVKYQEHHKWGFEMDPIELSHKMLNHIDQKRSELKLKPMIYKQAFRSE